MPVWPGGVPNTRTWAGYVLTGIQPSAAQLEGYTAIISTDQTGNPARITYVSLAIRPAGLGDLRSPYNGGRMRLCPVKGYYAPGKRPGLGIGMRASAGWLCSQRAPTARNRHYEQALAVSGGHDRACARQLPRWRAAHPAISRERFIRPSGRTPPGAAMYQKRTKGL
jgi:hypothetical protein